MSRTLCVILLGTVGNGKVLECSRKIAKSFGKVPDRAGSTNPAHPSGFSFLQYSKLTPQNIATGGKGTC